MLLFYIFIAHFCINFFKLRKVVPLQTFGQISELVLKNVLLSWSLSAVSVSMLILARHFGLLEKILPRLVDRIVTHLAVCTIN